MAIYKGKKRFKTVAEIARIAAISSTKRVTMLAKPLARQGLFEQGRERIDGTSHTVYRKNGFVEANKQKILRLAKNKAKLEGYHSKTNPRAPNSGRVILRLPFTLRTRFVRVDDVEQFAQVKAVRSVPDHLVPERLSERCVKSGILRLLRETKAPKDWGGETNDVFTTKLRLGGRTRRAAFALKGPAKTGPLVPRMMGKNGDQIQRLFSSPAEVFFVQYEGEIKESVIALMQDLATAKAALGAEVFFGVIDKADTYRLRLAYVKAFRAG